MGTPAVVRFSSTDRPEGQLVGQYKDGHPCQVVPMLQRVVRLCKQQDPATVAALYVELENDGPMMNAFLLSEREYRESDVEQDHFYELVLAKDPKARSWREGSELVIDGGEYRGPLGGWGWDEESWTHTASGQRAIPAPPTREQRKAKLEQKSAKKKKKTAKRKR